MLNAKTQTKALYKELAKLGAKYNRKKKMGFISFNQKTGISMDVDSKCNKKLEGKPCKYCYVEMKKLNKFMGIKEKDYCEAVWDEEVKGNLINFCKEAKKLNLPFVRLFSKSDYKQEHKEFWTNVITTIQDNGIPVSLITKQKATFSDLGKIVNTFQYSVDLEDNNEIKYAQSLKRKADNVKIRAVITDSSQVEVFEKAGVDIATFFHNDGTGENRKRLKELYPETTQKHWKPENFKDKTTMTICCIEKGDAKHAKCGACLGCLK